MSMINSVGNVLSNNNISKVAEGATKAVLIMTGIKAVARPAFIYADNKSDAETKKYTATKEFLYQMLCLGITFAMLPICEKGGFKLGEKYLKNNEVTKAFLEKASKVEGGIINTLFKNEKIGNFKEEIKVVTEPFKAAEKVLKDANATDEAKKAATKTIAEQQPVIDAIHAGMGGKELGSLVGSVVGLTLLAPIISHEILHPIMKAIGMDKKADNAGKPAEPFLADAKVSEEKKVDTKA